jgi:hypothetical protein
MTLTLPAANQNPQPVVRFPPDFVGSTFGCGPFSGVASTVTVDPKETYKPDLRSLSTFFGFLKFSLSSGDQLNLF